MLPFAHAKKGRFRYEVCIGATGSAAAADQLGAGST
jgi:hypothetical protein